MPKKNDTSKEFDKFIGNKLYSLRLARGMSREQLSSLLSVSHQQISKYEKGGDRISVSRLFLISKALKEDVAYFFKNFDENVTEELNTQHQRLCMEVSRNFMKIKHPEHQQAVGDLVKVLSKLE